MDIVLFDSVLIAKVIENQVLHYAKYLTGSIGSSHSSSSSSRRHGLIRVAIENRGAGNSRCEVPDS